MTKEKKKVETIELSQFSSLDGIDLSAGYVCDVETGICGPTEEMKNESVEEKKNENNNLV